MMTTLDGLLPVGVLEMRVLSEVWNTESEPSSGFTIATSESSSEIAIVLERETRVENTGGGGGAGSIPPVSGGGGFPWLSVPQPAAWIASDVQRARASLG
ncbi:MAG TPA: hypothetical protein VFT22_28715 [Kofleriaceae bacterium]|nr:hypothetical protein [Kofleriaceae bacterium]